MLIDAHTHLNTSQLFENWKEYLQNFESRWWVFLVNAWANSSYNAKWLEISKNAKIFNKNLIVKIAIWWHPCDIPTDKDFKDYITELRDLYLANQDNIVAIGECWIDLHFSDNPSLELQQYALKLHAKLARELNLPLMIHSRDAFHETMEVLKEFSDLKIYFHAWWYWPEQLAEAESVFPNLRIWCTNVIAYPSAQIIRDAIQNIKTAKILTETDAPYLPPQCFRGQQNEPAYVSYVYDKLSELLNIKKSSLESLIKKNTEDFYWSF